MIFKEIAFRSPDWNKAVKLREEVLRKPLGSTFSEEELQEEQNYFQIAGFLDDELVATAVLVPEGNKMKMQRVAVLEHLRNQQVGSKMLAFCEALASTMNVKVLYCHARDTAVNFYAKNHYQQEGNYFDEDGIPHLKMVKIL